jgi:hypothetical protein
MLLSVGLPLRVYIYGGAEVVSGYEKTHVRHFQTRCVQLILVPPSASIKSVGEQASEIAVRRATLARVCGRLGFWSVLATARSVHSTSAEQVFFVVSAVRGTTLRTSACIDCVQLHRADTRDISYEWSH